MTSESNTEKALHLDETTFDAEVLQSSVPVLVDFWAPWCGPCKIIGPAVEQLASDYAGRAKVAKVNVDIAPALAARYGITSIPSLVFFKNGEIVDTYIGAVPKNLLSTTLDKLI